MVERGYSFSCGCNIIDLLIDIVLGFLQGFGSLNYNGVEKWIYRLGFFNDILFTIPLQRK